MIDTFADQSSLYDSRCARLLGRLCALVDDTYKSNPSLCRIAIVTAIVPHSRCARLLGGAHGRPEIIEAGAGYPLAPDCNQESKLSTRVAVGHYS